MRGASAARLSSRSWSDRRARSRKRRRERRSGLVSTDVTVTNPIRGSCEVAVDRGPDDLPHDLIDAAHPRGSHARRESRESPTRAPRPRDGAGWSYPRSSAQTLTQVPARSTAPSDNRSRSCARARRPASLTSAPPDQRDQTASPAARCPGRSTSATAAPNRCRSCVLQRPQDLPLRLEICDSFSADALDMQPRHSIHDRRGRLTRSTSKPRHTGDQAATPSRQGRRPIGDSTSSTYVGKRSARTRAAKLRRRLAERLLDLAGLEELEDVADLDVGVALEHDPALQAARRPLGRRP